MGVEYSINVTEYYDSNKLSSADIKDEIDFPAWLVLVIHRPA